jgi:hypothetical protein
MGWWCRAAGTSAGTCVRSERPAAMQLWRLDIMGVMILVDISTGWAWC